MRKLRTSIPRILAIRFKFINECGNAILPRSILNLHAHQVCICSTNSSSLSYSTSNSNFSDSDDSDGVSKPDSMSIEAEPIPVFDEKWTEQQLKLKENAIQRDEWTLVYRYNRLMWLFIVIRSVPVIVAASWGSLFFAVYQNFFQLNFAELKEELAPFIASIILANVIFFLSQSYLTRMISVVSVDTQTKSIYRIGFFTIWGKRRNEYVRAGDLLSLRESNPRGISGGVAKVGWAFKPTDESLLLPLKNCEIADGNAIHLFLGSQPVPQLLQMQLNKLKESRKEPVIEESMKELQK